MNFASDNVEGASPGVIEAVLRANDGAAPAYGADAWTARVEKRFAEIFERDVAVFLVATGTAANALSIAAAVAPWGSCLCHIESHVADDECGAPEFFSHGAKLIGLPGTGCKLEASEVARTLDRLPDHVKQMPAQAVSISQATECGLVYEAEEIADIGELCRARGLALHMDGARFANALVRLGASPAEMTWKAGVDILSFGATKNGCLAAEAVIVFEPRLAETLAYRRKRAGQTFSKARFIAAQLEAYLADDAWLAQARHANAMAQRLSARLAAIAGVRLAWPTQSNTVFAILPAPLDRALREAGVLFHPWSDLALARGETVAADEVLVRFVTSFATRPEAVDALVRSATNATSGPL
jgi:threonine aldolase